MELAIGPVLFEWKRSELLDFYDKAARSAVDRVYLGEVVCVKKRGLSIDDMLEVGRGLERAGKKVVVSTLAVVSNDEELDLVRRVLDLPFAVEANDMSVFNMADPKEREIYAGPHITTYNVPSVECLAELGVRGVCAPVELSRESLRYNIEHTSVPTEVFCHGKVPLAFSWRCYTSRAYGRTKGECAHDCARWPDGMETATLDGERAFTINGTSVLSAATYSLVEYVEDLEAIGVAALRISPGGRDTFEAVDIFRRRMDGALSAEEAAAELEALSPGGLCNGWYLAGPGKVYISAAQGLAGAS
ncbi:MAG TPA: U32 family peptidase [Deltaproteobacteria bacterium]|nr:U32 family peptidase [Deltaproteobacteria bacterium]